MSLAPSPRALQCASSLLTTQQDKLLDGWTPPESSKKEPEPEDDTKNVSPEPEEDASPAPKKKRKVEEAPEKVDEPADDEVPPPVAEEDEYSDVIDEPVKPKRKSKDKSAPAKPTKRKASSDASAPAKKKASSPDDPDEAEIKKLQGQLVKCGVRKLWHNELKKYDDDSRAKIRHLRKMLTDIGMDGRFSEARAREIKETRELMAEAEAAQEMNALWGMDGGGRASRSKAKAQPAAPAKKVQDSDEEDQESGGGGDDDDDEEGEEASFAVRRRRAQADLAFLGDDDSDSD